MIHWDGQMAIDIEDGNYIRAGGSPRGDGAASTGDAGDRVC